MSHPANATSPLRPGAASTRTLQPPGHAKTGGGISTEEFRSSLKLDIATNVLYNKDEVLDKLLTPTEVNSWPSADKRVISALVAMIKQKCEEDLKEINRIEKSKAGEERFLYPHLSNIFGTVEKEAAKSYQTRTIFRQLISTDADGVLLEDPVYPDGTMVKPDFVLADMPPPAPGFATKEYPSTKLRWRQCSSFIEVKAKSNQLPHPARLSLESEIVKESLAQASDYARLLLAGRPFMLYTYGFFICGNAFCVGLFDRCGVAISSKYVLSDKNDEDLEKFVCIVVRLLFEMSPVELGQDPTVRLLPMNPPQTYYQDAFPRFIVTLGGHNDTRKWTTIGPPVWVSHTLLGRGTSVWRAIGHLGQSPAILKVAWRTSNREPELNIYDRIRKLLSESEDSQDPGTPESSKAVVGIAQATHGGDVCHNGVPISVSKLRQFDTLQPTGVNRLLHRVSLSTFGKPLWKYSSVEELVLALLEVIEGHKVLCEKGILHRDISAGNVLIKVDASYKPATPSSPEDIIQADLPINEAGGFLTDFEFASFPHPREQTRYELEPGKTTFVEVTEKVPPKLAGEGITGTTIFLATSLLVAIENKRTARRTVEQDLESFLWVILYAIYKHSLDELDPHTEFRRELAHEFCNIFAARDATDLLKRRIQAFNGNFKMDDDEEPLRSLPIRHLCQCIDGRRSHLMGFLVYAVWSPLRKRFREIKDEGLKASFPPDLKRFMHYYGDENDSGHAGRKTILTHQVLIETLQALLESERMARSV